MVYTRLLAQSGLYTMADSLEIGSPASLECMKMVTTAVIQPDETASDMPDLTNRCLDPTLGSKNPMLQAFKVSPSCDTDETLEGCQRCPS